MIPPRQCPKSSLSYSRDDLEFASWLNELLVGDGVKCFFDRDSIQPGADWVETLEKAVEDADVLVLVVTPSYLRSKWTKMERNAAMAASSSCVGKTPIPLLRKDCTLPPSCPTSRLWTSVPVPISMMPASASALGLGAGLKVEAPRLKPPLISLATGRSCVQ